MLPRQLKERHDLADGKRIHLQDRGSRSELRSQNLSYGAGGDVGTTGFPRLKNEANLQVKRAAHATAVNVSFSGMTAKKKQ